MASNATDALRRNLSLEKDLENCIEVKFQIDLVK